MVFKKERMLKRLETEGKLELVGEKELAIMDNLDGMEANTANWNRVVNGTPTLSCKGKDGKVYDVHEDDCI